MQSITLRKTLRLVGAGLLALWAGMARGENRLQELALPESYFSDAVTAGTDADAVAAGWWHNFHDSLLDSLISLGRQNNYNLAAAAARIEAARAGVAQARAAYFPTIGVQAGWSDTRTASGMGTTSTWRGFDAQASLSWQIDVFGKIHEQVKQAKAEVGLSAAEAAGVALSIDAEIADTYTRLLVARGQLTVAREHSRSQERVLQIARDRHEAGLASKLDVAQASTLYYSTVAQIPLLEAQIDADVNALAVLTGTTREGLPSEIETAEMLPAIPGAPALGAPVELIRRRPDIVQAEKSVASAAAALGVARKEYLPSLSVEATVGTRAHSAGDLLKNNSFGYSIAPTLSWTVFDGLGRQASAAAARQNVEAAMNSYYQTVLTAVEDVRNAAREYNSTLVYIDNVERVASSAEEEVRLSVDLYKEGLTPFSNVVDAMLNYLTYQNTLVAAKGQALENIINLYQALGGGWEYNN